MTRAWTTEAPAARTANAADWIRAPDVHVSSKTRTCIPLRYLEHSTAPLEAEPWSIGASPGARQSRIGGRPSIDHKSLRRGCGGGRLPLREGTTTTASGLPPAAQAR